MTMRIGSNPYMGYTNVYQLASTPYTPTEEDMQSGLAFQLMYPEQTTDATTATTPTVATTTYNNTPVSTPAFQDSQSTTSTTQYNDIQSQISALIKSLMQPTTTSTGSTTSGTTSTPTGNYASSGFGSLYGFPQDTFYDTRKTGWNAGTNW